MANEERHRHSRGGGAAGAGGAFWFAGWLFTWGLLHLGLPKVLFALLIWPYYLGAALKLPG